ncbi:ECF transporter S component, partial [Jeotgalibaca porci]
MKKNKTHQLVLFAMFASLTTVMTLLFRIPIPSAQGYVNIGDTILLLAALI